MHVLWSRIRNRGRGHHRKTPDCPLHLEVLEDRCLLDGSPYGPSPVVARFVIHPSRISIGEGDNWPVTWGDDNALYTFFQDGAGFGTEAHSMAPARITGDPPNITGENIVSPTGTMEGGGAAGRKVSGLLMVNASPDGAALPTLYAWVRNLHPNADDSDATGASLIWSDDHGATWNWEPEWSFADQIGYPVWLNAGQDYGAAPDPAHVYFYSPDGPSAYQTYADIMLGRVATDRITDPNAYEFFTGLDAAGDPQWGNFAHHVPVFSNPAGSFRPGVVYDPFIDRYLLSVTASYDSSQNYLGIFDAPTPWGPWTTVTYQDGWGGDPENRFAPQLPSNWMSPDGRHLYLEYSALNGPYQFNIQKVSLRLFSAADTPANAARVGGLALGLPQPLGWVLPATASCAGNGVASDANARTANSLGEGTDSSRWTIGAVAESRHSSAHATPTKGEADALALMVPMEGDDITSL